MKALLVALLDSVSRFRAAQTAVAAVEFALVVPVLLVLYLGSVDISQGISADRKLSSVAGTLGDLVAQSRDSLPISVLNDYFSASQAIMLPFDGADTALLVTIASIDVDRVARVRASEARNGATPRELNSVISLPVEITSLAAGGFLVISEAWYNYTPIVGYVVPSDINLYKQFFYVPRFGEEIRIVPG